MSFHSLLNLAVCVLPPNYFYINVSHDTIIDRGTRRYQIRVSPDRSTWATVAASILADPRTPGECNEPLEHIRVGNRNDRFIEFKAIDYYGVGAALEYLSVL